MDPYDQEFRDAISNPIQENHSVEKEISSYLLNIKEAVGKSGNIKRDIKLEILLNIKKIEELITIIPTKTSPTTTNITEDIKTTIKACIKEEINKIKIPAPIINPPTPLPNTSYAKIISTPVQSTQLRPPPYKPAIIVTAKNATSTSDTLTAWQKSISFKDTNFAPENIKPVSNNKLRVEFNKQEDLHATLKKIHPSSVIAAEPSKTLQPMVILKGISSHTPPETLTTIIRNQNDFIKNNQPQNISLKFIRNNKNPNLYNAVFTTSPTLWRSITDAGKLNVDHQRVHVQDFIPIRQCFRCLQYGHTKKWCKENTSTCSHCSSTSHSYHECPSKNDPSKLSCFNCKKRHSINNSVPAHSATSNTCPCYINMTKVIRTRIDYGQ